MKHKKNKKILVIRLKQIGDALLALPVCNSLRKAYPDAEIHYLVYQHITPLLENQPAIDKLQVITPQERKNKLLYAKKIIALRKQQYDIVLDLINVPISAITTFVSGAPLTVGFDKKKARKHLYKRTVKRTVKHTNQDRNSSSVKLDILKGLDEDITLDTQWEIPVEKTERGLVREIMQSYGVDFTKPIAFIAATSRRTDKLWPQEYLIQSINHIQQQHNCQIVFNWVPGAEGDYVEALTKKLESQKGVFSNIDLTLKQLPIAISQCDFFFGNDGGPHHMAVGTGVHSLVIYPPFHSKRTWLPHNKPQHQGIDLMDSTNISMQEFNDNRKQIKIEHAAYYQKITPELVLEKLDSMLPKALKS